MNADDENDDTPPKIIHRDTEDSKNEDTNEPNNDLTPKQAWCLYLSHFLSMWISRTYEYATILFIQSIFPGDLLPSSINGIAETVCVLVSSAALGRWVDQSPSRLRPLLLSILANRSTLVVCCVLWLIVFSSTSAVVHRLFFAIILVLGMVEKASRMSNTLSVERDWIPTIASYTESGPVSYRPRYHLTHLNTVIRRIDIACKFLAPLAISGVMIVVQPWFAALLVGLVGALGCVVEIWSALFVWKSSQRLREAKQGLPAQSKGPWPTSITSRVVRSMGSGLQLFVRQLEGFSYWLSTEVWIPSMGTAILHASVLAWSGTLITWLLNGGLSYAEITVAKSVGSAFEISSTFVFPWLVKYFSKRGSAGKSGGTYQMISREEDDEPEGGESGRQQRSVDIAQAEANFGDLGPIITTAKWSIISLVICLVPALISLFILDNQVDQNSSQVPPSGPTTEATFSIFLVTPFLIFLSFSFLGRWTYDLSITQLTQVAIPARRRSEFGGTEMALVSLVSLMHWVAAAIWHRQEDFKWLALGSVIAVVGAAGAYLYWDRYRKRARIGVSDTE